MTAHEHLQPRQFTPDQVEHHVEGAFAMGDVQATDRFEKRLIPLENVYAGGRKVLDIHPVEMDGESVADYGTSKVRRYQKDMKKNGAAHYPPVVVADQGDGTHEFLDGYHRMHAATANGIRHGVAYVRTNRRAWE